VRGNQEIGTPNLFNVLEIFDHTNKLKFRFERYDRRLAVFSLIEELCDFPTAILHICPLGLQHFRLKTRSADDRLPIGQFFLREPCRAQRFRQVIH
jgi:hypothetical protein